MSRPRRTAALNMKVSYKENVEICSDDDPDFKTSSSKLRKRRTAPQASLKTSNHENADETDGEVNPKNSKRRHTVPEGEAKIGQLDVSVSVDAMTVIEQPNFEEGLTLEATAGCPLVFFDLETTGIGRDCEITQIGAANGSKKHNRYLFPERGINPFVQKLTGITVVGRQMFYKKKEVDSVDAKQGLLEFFGWLEKIGTPVILVAHNAKAFDSRVLIQVALEHNLLDNLQKAVIGFSDTLLLFRSKFPRSNNFKLKTLAKQYCQGDFAWHNAMADVNAMMKLCQATNVSRQEFVANSFSTDFSRRVLEFTPMIDDGCFQKEIARKIVTQRLSVGDLELAALDGLDALGNVLKMITTYKPMIQRIHSFFETQRFSKEDFVINDELEKSLNEIEMGQVSSQIGKSGGKTTVSRKITAINESSVEETFTKVTVKTSAVAKDNKPVQKGKQTQLKANSQVRKAGSAKKAAKKSGPVRIESKDSIQIESKGSIQIESKDSIQIESKGYVQVESYDSVKVETSVRVDSSRVATVRIEKLSSASIQIGSMEIQSAEKRVDDANQVECKATAKES